MIGILVRGCRCAASWCDLDLTFDLAIVTLTCKILFGLYPIRFRNLILDRVIRLGLYVCSVMV